MDESRTATLVLGADSDMGAEIIKGLSGNIIAHYYAAPEKLRALASERRKIYPVCGDLSTVADIGELVDAVDALGFDIDRIAHLPSSPARPQRFREFSPESFERDFNICFMSAAMCCKTYMPRMAKRRFGRVVFMISSYAYGAPPKFIAEYVACKSALAGLMRALAAEYADRGVTVNGVAPSMTETAFIENLPEFSVEERAKHNPTGRNATPADIAPAFRMLLSDEADYINGAVLPVTGGETML